MDRNRGAAGEGLENDLERARPAQVHSEEVPEAAMPNHGDPQRRAPLSELESVPQQDIEGAVAAFKNGGLSYLQDYLTSKGEEWKQIDLNIGVIGNAGVGKTTLINTILSLTADDKGAGKTGVVETTTEPMAYAHPDNPKMKLWDLPGVGTPRFPRETYLRVVQYEKFDFFLIVTNKRFTENDMWIASEINVLDKQFYFIRTKVAFDVRNDKRDYPKMHSTQKVLTELREDIKANLGKLYDERKIFLIDSRGKQYDFNQMVSQLLEDFPRLKREALAMTLRAFSTDIIRKKVEFLRGTLWGAAMLSAVGGAVPIMGVSAAIDLGILTDQVRMYRKQLGIDERSLQAIAEASHVDPVVLRNVAGAHPFTFATVEISKVVSKYAAAIAAEEVARFIPVIGSIVGAGISFGATFHFLSTALTKMEEAAIEVVEITTGNHQA